MHYTIKKNLIWFIMTVIQKYFFVTDGIKIRYGWSSKSMDNDLTNCYMS